MLPQEPWGRAAVAEVGNADGGELTDVAVLGADLVQETALDTQFALDLVDAVLRVDHGVVEVHLAVTQRQDGGVTHHEGVVEGHHVHVPEQVRSADPVGGGAVQTQQVRVLLEGAFLRRVVQVAQRRLPVVREGVRQVQVGLERGRGLGSGGADPAARSQVGQQLRQPRPAGSTMWDGITFPGKGRRFPFASRSNGL